jgi:hypothetical protein
MKGAPTSKLLKVWPGRALDTKGGLPRLGSSNKDGLPKQKIQEGPDFCPVLVRAATVFVHPLIKSTASGDFSWKKITRKQFLKCASVVKYDIYKKL